MRHKKLISLYTSPELFLKIDAARDNISRSSFIENKLLKVFSVNE